MFRFLSRGLLLGLVLVAMAPGWAAMVLPGAVPGFSVVAQERFPLKALRGYGSLQGAFAEFAGAEQARVSVLLIDCPDAARAGVTLGKYRSDVHSLGGVTDATIPVHGQATPVMRAEGQGSLVALRMEAQVAVVAATREGDLAAALTALGPLEGADFTGGAVPAYLDKFDKDGWSFWYQPLTTPKGQEATYDSRQDFEFVKRMGTGLQISLSTNASDTAEEVINYAGQGWAIELAREYGIPVFIQPFILGGSLSLANRFPYDMQWKMPQFIGTYYDPSTNAYNGAPPGVIGWASVRAKDTVLSALSTEVRRYASYPNVVGYAEPHSEIEHSTPMIFTEYGPVADAAYRRFLREKYGTPAAVDQRWSGGQGMVTRWEDVRVPEVANFLGWGRNALDVGGEWRVAYEKSLTPAQLTNWASPTLDDSAWTPRISPGDDHAMLRPERTAPAVFRRTVTLTEAQVNALREKGQGKFYLYVLSLERAIGKKIAVAVNGTPVGERAVLGSSPGWGAFEVSGQMRAGANLIALRLPFGFLAYRIYLSSVTPRCYPDLGPQLNARWVDFRDFAVWMRGEAVRKGMEAIRREDPDKYIKMASPDGMVDLSKALAEDFGGGFHNTGHMSGWWNDYLPSLMRSSGLPFTIEPGNGAPDLRTLKLFFGRWMTEGVNGVFYFQNLGEILWDPAQKAWFEANQPLVHLVGKFHFPQAQVAVLYGARGARLLGPPWDQWPEDTMGIRKANWSNWLVQHQLPYPRDLLVENDFARGNADKYRLIVDQNTVIMDEALVSRIEQWVRNGGIFVTYGQTGRHTPEIKDAWPIARLTGYRVTAHGVSGRLTPCAGQSLFTSARWAAGVNGGGMRLEKVAPECQDLLRWPDGSTAVGMRTLGKGAIIQMGAMYADPFTDVLRGYGIDTANPRADECRTVPYTSNNGLYDVTVLWAEGVKDAKPVTLTFPGNTAPAMLRDVLTGETLTGTRIADGMAYAHIAMTPNDTRAYLAPRGKITSAARDWFLLQREWWKGTKTPSPAPETRETGRCLRLNEQCAFSPIANGVNGASLAAPAVDDRTWARLDLGIWNAKPEFADVRHGIFRKQFVIPAGWQGAGRSWLWLNGSGALTLRPPYRVNVYLDGAKVWGSGGNQYEHLVADLTEKLTPGAHVIAVEIASTTTMGGIIGDMWIEFIPDPVFRQSLAGSWGNGITLPGTAKLTGAKRTFIPDPRGKNHHAVLYVEGGKDSTIYAAYINNRFMGRYHMVRGEHFRINLTPWITWDAENTIELVPLYPNNAMTVSTIELRYYREDQL